MELPIAKQLSAALATIAEHEKTIASLKQSGETHAKQITDAVEAAVAPLNQTVATLTKERDEANKLATDTKAALTTKEQEVVALQGKDKSAGQKALDIAAGQATKPVGDDLKNLEGQGENKTYAQLLTDYRACTDPKERGVIWQKMQTAK